jgi:hypothetical protein
VFGAFGALFFSFSLAALFFLMRGFSLAHCKHKTIRDTWVISWF